MMQFAAGAEAAAAAFRLALPVRPQQIAGIVPQKVWEDTHRSRDRGRQLHGCGTQLGFLSNQSFCQQRHHRLQLPLCAQAQGIADLCGTPSGTANFSLLGQILKQLG